MTVRDRLSALTVWRAYAPGQFYLGKGEHDAMQDLVGEHAERHGINLRDVAWGDGAGVSGGVVSRRELLFVRGTSLPTGYQLVEEQ